MSRIRSIKPEINDDEEVASLSSDAWRLWVSLWPYCDDVGRMRAAPRFLQAKVFWAWTPSRSVEDLLAELVDHRRIRLYRVTGQWYLEVQNFLKHQKIDKPQPARHPGPEHADAQGVAVERDSGSAFVCASPVREDSRTVVDHSRMLGERSTGDWIRDQGLDQGRDRERESEGDSSLGRATPPKESGGRRRRPETACPPTEASAEALESWAAEWGIPTDHAEYIGFLSHHQAKESKFRDWLAAWRKWQANARRWGERGGRNSVQPTPETGRFWKVGTDG